MDNIQKQLLESLNEFTAFARKQLADSELAADAVQESLLKALKATEQVRDEKSAKAWFYRILRRTIIDLYRRHGVHERAIAKIESDIVAPSEEQERLICRCMDTLIPTLKPQYATLIRRLDLEGEALEPVASSLGITTNNLKVRLHRARQQLKQRLTQTCRMCAQHGCLDCTCDTASNQRKQVYEPTHRPPQS